MAASHHAIEKKVLEFWFSGLCPSKPVPQSLLKLWFGGNDAEVDALIRSEFMPIADAVLKDSGLEDALARTPSGLLAAIILFDQFPRNAFRGQAKAFSYDPTALRLARKFVDAGFSGAHPVMHSFALLPFEHSENIADQELSVRLFERLAASGTEYKELLDGFAKYAKTHYDIVEKFGRFPHRNKILGRTCTPEENQFLRDGGETFGTSK